MRGCRSIPATPRARTVLVALVATLATVAASTLVTVLMVIVLTGCGSSRERHGRRPLPLRQRRLRHFSLDVDRRFTQWRSATAGGGAAFEVAFVDAAGARAGARHLDALTVSVVDTGTTPTGSEAAQLTASLSIAGRDHGRPRWGPTPQAGDGLAR